MYSNIVDWEVALAWGASGLTFVLWAITIYSTFLRNRFIHVITKVGFERMLAEQPEAVSVVRK